MAATAKEIALKGCDSALHDAIAKSVMVLARELLSAKTPAGKQKCLDRFREGVLLHSSTHDQAVKIVTAM